MPTDKERYRESIERMQDDARLAFTQDDLDAVIGAATMLTGKHLFVNGREYDLHTLIPKIARYLPPPR